MKNLSPIFIYLYLSTLLFACQFPIDVNLKEGSAQLAVDAWVSDQTSTQKVKLTQTVNYFDNSPVPAIRGAVVVITDDLGNVYPMAESLSAPGEYITTTLRGQIGRKYTLNIRYQGEEYTATTSLKRVPAIDSLPYEFKEERLGISPGYYALFYARDIVGLGDYYRFKVYKNGIMYNKPENLVVTRDEFTDGLLFIPPIRDTFNPFQSDTEKRSYQKGDVVRAEILSIDSTAYAYFDRVSTETTNGGLFARPIANVPTNIKNVNPSSNKKAVGFFYASAVSFLETTIK